MSFPKHFCSICRKGFVFERQLFIHSKSCKEVELIITINPKKQPKTPKFLNCLNCNKRFEKPNQKKYCCQECKTEYKKLHNKHKPKKRIRNTRWINLTHKIMQRPCAMCGGKSQASHHIIPVSVNPELQFEESNLMPLCNKCHREQHPELPDIFFTSKSESVVI